MKTKIDDLILLDSNVLIYAEMRDDERYEEASSLRDRALRGEFAACISPQILSEFFSSITHTGRRGPEQVVAPADAANRVRLYYEAELFDSYLPRASND